MHTRQTPLAIPVHSGGAVSALLDAPVRPAASYVFAHGAGAGMHHAFMAALAEGLTERDVAVLRFQFPYMENRSGRPDSPTVAHATIRAAVHEARRQLPGVPLFAGGKSYGGRMTSQAQAAEPLVSVRGLIFVGFPLHPAGKASVERAAHLTGVTIPMLFLQGSRDALADSDLMRQVTAPLGTRATLHPVAHADHSFHVLKRSGRTDGDVLNELLDTTVAWMEAH